MSTLSVKNTVVAGVNCANVDSQKSLIEFTYAIARQSSRRSASAPVWHSVWMSLVGAPSPTWLAFEVAEPAQAAAAVAAERVAAEQQRDDHDDDAERTAADRRPGGRPRADRDGPRPAPVSSCASSWKSVTR